MKRYFAIYRQLLRLNLQALFVYRFNFVNNVVASVGWGAMSLYTVILLTARVTEAYGWTHAELLLFNGVYGIIVGIFHMFISINMGRLSRIIHMGELDGILLKPIDSQFAVSLWWVNFTTIVRILMALGFTVWVIASMHVTITPFQIGLFLVFSVSAIMLLYSIWFLVLTNIMWFTDLSNLVLFMYSFESMARFPKEMLLQLGGFVFLTVLPIALVINTPARALMGKVSIPDSMTVLLLAIFLFLASRKYWKFALRHYTSASG